MYQVTLVNYINTYPYIKGLEAAGSLFHLDKRIPKECGEVFLRGEADFALVPVAFLPRLDSNFQVIKNYGIACDGAVHSVKLLSEVPVGELTELRLDPHSTTSVELIKVLMKEYWNKSLVYNDLDLNNMNDQQAALLIGDKVFKHENDFTYQYDLGEKWKAFTGLPFVFAVWVCKSDIAQSVIKEFTALLAQGLTEINVIAESQQAFHPLVDLNQYLNQNIKFKLDDNYLDGLSRFFELSSLNKRSYEFI